MTSKQNAKQSLITMMFIAGSVSTSLVQANAPHPDESWQGWNKYVAEARTESTARGYAHGTYVPHPDESWQGWNKYVAESEGRSQNMGSSHSGYKHPDESWTAWNEYVQQSLNGS